MKTGIFNPTLIGMVVFVTLMATTVSADTQPQQSPTIAQIYYNYAWTKDNWTGNNAPYQKARASMESSVASGVPPEALVKKLAVQAQQHPRNALLQFRRGYATFITMQDYRMTDDIWRNRQKEVLTALVSARPPSAYDFDRLHFLVLSDGLPHPQILGVGLRLLHKNPQDVLVKYAVASILDDSDSSADRQKAIVYANELVKQYPSVPKYYGLLAGVAYRTWVKTKSRIDARNAIAAYQHYLDIAPSDAYFRYNAQANINFIRQQQGHWDDLAHGN